MLDLLIIGIGGGITLSLLGFLVLGVVASPFVITDKINKYISKIENKNVSKLLKIIRNIIYVLSLICLFLILHRIFCEVLMLINIII
ncbi:hypothetical protein ACQR2L_01555 [Clostridium butyricum]|uniref:hypothetical protein n=1 Tax=Clostridium butyricum TaxID=1492 RepID=UPI00374E4AA5